MATLSKLASERLLQHALSGPPFLVGKHNSAAWTGRCCGQPLRLNTTVFFNLTQRESVHPCKQCPSVWGKPHAR